MNEFPPDFGGDPKYAAGNRPSNVGLYLMIDYFGADIGASSYAASTPAPVVQSATWAN